MLDKLANLFWKSKLHRHLLFLFATTLSISFMGYYFGTFDQASHIPFLKKYIDPSLFPGDKFFDLRLVHYSYFWLLFEPIYKAGLLEPAMFIIYVFITYMTFWSIWRLSKTLFNNPLTSFVSILVFILPHMTFAGFSTAEFSLLNRIFVLPFLILSLDLFLRKKYIISFFLLGLMFNLHALSVNFVVFLILFSLIFEFRRINWTQLITGLVIFLITALPVLLWKKSTISGDFIAEKEWFSIIARSILPQIFFPLSLQPHILIATLSGISSIGLFYIAVNKNSLSKYDSTIKKCFWGGLLVVGISVLTPLFPIAILVEFQSIRISLFLLIFSYLYFAHFLVKLYRTGKLTSGNFHLLLGAMIFSISPFSLLVIFSLQQLLQSKKHQNLLMSTLVAVTFLITITVLYKSNIWRPGINIFMQKSDWTDVQLWAKMNTDKKDLFITPPYKWWLYEPSWHVFSERSQVTGLSELLEAAFSPDYIDYWKPRFEAVAPGALEKFKNNTFENFQITKQAFYALSTNDMKRLAVRYNASYLVIEKPYQYNFPVIYQNKSYLVYQLKTP